MITQPAVAAVLPQGYTAERERGAMVVALPSLIPAVLAAVREAGSLHAWAAGRPGARAFTGRGAAWGVDTEHGAWVVRHYRRGGAVARVLDDRYLRIGETRPLRELRASEAARERGVATPQVLAAVVYPAGAVYRADLVTAMVPDSTTLADAVIGDARVDARLRIATWRATGALLRRAFDAGIEHADLNMRNILIQWATSPAPFLLDLDRATVHAGALDAADRDGMLQRLHRSRRKLQAAAGEDVSAEELQAFDEALHAPDRDHG